MSQQPGSEHCQPPRRTDRIAFWVVIVVVAAVPLLLIAALARQALTGRHEMKDYPVVSGQHVRHESEIGGGTLGAKRWRLMASVNGNGDLCMGIRWAPGGDLAEDGCGFGKNDPDAVGEGQAPVASSQAADGQNLVFGPTPPHATTVRVYAGRNRDLDESLQDPNEIIGGPACRAEEIPSTPIPITHRLPSWYGGPRGGWFAVPVPEAASLHCLISLKFADAQGRAIEPPYNF